MALGALLTFGSGISLQSFGDLVGFGEISLGVFGPMVTIAAVIGAINTFNMIDGIDGIDGFGSGPVAGVFKRLRFAVTDNLWI